MAETTRLEGVYTIRLENGPALQQLERLTKELFDVRAEKTSLTKETRNLIKEEKNLEAEIKRTGAATEDQAKRLADVRKRREENNRAVAEAITVERGLSGQTRELTNDLSGLTEQGLRFRDKMSDAFTKALEGSQIFQQLGARAEFLQEELAKGGQAMAAQEQRITELNAALKSGATTEEEFKREMALLNDEVAKGKVANEALQNELQGVTGESEQLKVKIQQLNEQYRKGEIDQAAYREGLSRIEAETKNAVASTGALTDKFDAFVQGQGKELKSTLGSLALQYVGIGAAVNGFVNIIGSGVKTIREFDQANANLASILGKSKGEISALTQSALQLGPALGRLPSEVTDLQTELAKLGFTEQQILDAQEAVVLLANATGEGLGKSAEVAAATVKGFGLTAEDTQRVVDVMAQSFNATSLDLEKFSVAMATVAPQAKQAGFGIEETTALIGVLADRGLDASVAGTALRSMFIDLSKTGMSLDEALDQINNSTNKTKTAFELFGERAAGSAVILAENRSELERVTDSLDLAAGAAKNMAEVQQNTLDGATKKMTASWDAFVLSLENGEGVLGRTLKSLAEVTASALQVASGVEGANEVLNKMVADANKKVFEQLSAFSKDATEEQLRAIQRTVAERIKQLSGAFDQLDGAAKVKVEEDLRKQVMIFDQLTKAIREKNKASGEGTSPIQAEAEATQRNAETVTQARERITTAIQEERAALSELDVTNTQGIEQSNLRIATLERELSAIDGKITKTEQLSESERKHLELQREMQALANEAPTAVAGIGAGDIAAGAATPVPTQQPDQFGIIDTSRLESAVDTTTGLLEQYDREQEAFQNLQDAKLGAIEGFANAFGQLAAKGSNAAQFLFAIEKAAAIAQVIVNGIREVSAITAIYPIGTPLTPVALAAIAAAKIRTATSVAAIGAQAIAGFAEGGEIGPSGTVTSAWGTPITRANGDNVLVRAGGSFVTLRTGEKVLNEDQQRELERRTHKQIWGDIGLPGYTSSMTDFRRSQYLAGFADGGEIIGSITPRPSPATIVQNQVVSSLTDYAERPVYVDVREVTSTQRRVEVQETRSSL